MPIPARSQFYIDKYLTNFGKQPVAPQQPAEIPQYSNKYMQMVPQITPTKQPAESKFSVGREALRGVARAGETVAGLPMDIISALGWGIGKIIDPMGPGIQPIGGEAPLTSSWLRKHATTPAAEYLFGKGVLDPQTPREEATDRFISNATSLLAGKFPAKTAIAASGLGALSRWGSESAGFGPGISTAAEVGPMLLATAIPMPRLKNVIGSHYAKESEYLNRVNPIVTSREATPWIRQMNDLVNKKTRAGAIPDALKSQFKGIMNEHVLRNGNVPLKELRLWKDHLNDYFPHMNAYQRKFVKPLNDSLNIVFESVGKSHPEWYQSYTTANSLEKARHANTVMQDVIEELVPGKTLSKYARAWTVLSHGTKGLALHAADEVGKILKEPALRKHYLGLLKGVEKKSRPLIIKNLAGLNQNLETD